MSAPLDWRKRNPFTQEYLQQEIDFCGFVDHKGHSVEIKQGNPAGRMDDLLNAYFWDGSTTVPAMFIDGKLWMSITRMEVQSQHLPILWAEGNVATIGLGMGHFTMRAMAKPEVETVTVYERRREVIDYFRQNQHHRPGFDKVQFVFGDALATCVGQTYDFLYVDKYATLCADQVMTDMSALMYMNDICGGSRNYHFWGLEKVLAEAVLRGECSLHQLPIGSEKIVDFYHFLAMWQETEVARGITLMEMYRPTLDKQYIHAVLSMYRKTEGEWQTP